MGVIYAEADDGPNLLYPFIVEKGGCRDVGELLKLYHPASLGKITSADFWKFVGLRRMAQMLRPGGRFYLFDVVFPSEVKDYETRFDEWIGSMSKVVGAEFTSEVEAHIRDEYSTYDWVMEGYLTRAGFRIDDASYTGGYNATYVCTKIV